MIILVAKKIAERPSAEAPGPRRDEGVDEHPRPRNNAGTGVSAPELDFFLPAQRQEFQTPTIPFRQEFLAISIPMSTQACTRQPNLPCALASKSVHAKRSLSSSNTFFPPSPRAIT